MKAAPHPESEEELLDVRLLRMFELIYDTRSVTRASERMGQKQPTLSIWLSKLRSQLNDPLFVRTSTGMQPTPRAEALIVTARAVLQSLREVTGTRLVFDPATATRQFRICMADSSHLCLLPQLLAHVRAVAPKVRLVAARIDGQTAHALESGEADLAVGFVPWLESGFYQQKLFPQDWVCLVNAKHPRIGDTLTLDAYKAESHVAVTGGTGAQLLDDAMSRHGVHRHVVLELPGFLGLSGIVSATDLIATLPRQIGETLAGLVGVTVMPCPLGVPSVDIKQHWHARFHHDPGSQWLRGVVAKALMC
ncbi:MAG: LysR family transcriptional regulator [Rubrivivax sp.]|nr:LysR family transcriptional regulator [Rubrivivax sp.]